MQLKIVKLDLTELTSEVRRVGDILEAIMVQTNPIPPDTTFVEDREELHAFYGNDDLEIIKHKLKLLGKEYKEPKK